MAEWRIYILQYGFLESADKIRTREFPASSDDEAEKKADKLARRIRKRSSSTMVSVQLFKQIFKKNLVKEGENATNKDSQHTRGTRYPRTS